MRLIGNKSRLLPKIEGFLRDRGVKGGTFFDVFSGTGAVARHFKRLGFRVVANDHLHACYAQAVANVEVSSYPSFRSLREEYRDRLGERAFRESLAVQLTLDLKAGGGKGSRVRPRSRSKTSDPEPLRAAIHLLNVGVEPRRGLIFRNYAPGGGKGRMYFTDGNAQRIDGILQFLRENLREGVLAHGEFHLLLSALLDAADKVANISGTYGAFLKRWQRSALQPLHLEVPEVIESPLTHEAYREDANALVRRIPCDVLYIDPPYTDRQYPANYHILEILAEHHRIEDLEAYEASLYGKTGLRPYQDIRSHYCVAPGPNATSGNVLVAMADLIWGSKAKHILVSYSEEGLLTREELGALLCRFEGKRSFNFRRGLRLLPYRRFRSDSDRLAGHERGKRQYRVLHGKGRDQISEWLFHASRSRIPNAGPRKRKPSLEETT